MHRSSEVSHHEAESSHRRVVESALLRVPMSHVTQRFSGRLEVQLSGALPENWCLRLAKGLSAARVGLLNGYARDIGERIWICQLEVQHESGTGRVPDFLDLAMNGTLRRRGEEPPILDYQLTDLDARGGVLEVRIVAHDAIGLLAAVLLRVRAAGLVLDELIVATEEEAATHRVTVRRSDGSAPGPLDRRALASSLDRLVRSR